MASRTLKFSKCLQPSKIRAGNTQPVNSFIDLVGSTPVLGVSSLIGKMKTFQQRQGFILKLQTLKSDSKSQGKLGGADEWDEAYVDEDGDEADGVVGDTDWRERALRARRHPAACTGQQTAR